MHDIRRTGTSHHKVSKKSIKRISSVCSRPSARPSVRSFVRARSKATRQIDALGTSVRRDVAERTTTTTMTTKGAGSRRASDAEIAELRARVFDGSTTTSSQTTIKSKEAAIEALGAAYASRDDAGAFATLFAELRPMFADAPKAKTAKIVRTLIEIMGTIAGNDALQVELCREQVDWARRERRTFLRHRVELRLATLHLQMRDYPEALRVVGSLAREVKKLDDKLLLVDIHLLESRIHYALRNLPKSKASLTAARTNANAIYVPPSVQCQIDMQSGILHADEKDYKTAYSYFFEAFEQLNSLDDKPTAVTALKYMLMCKIMCGQADDVGALISSKGGLQHQGESALDAMKAVSEAYKARSLKDLQSVLHGYSSQLGDDPIIAAHLGSLQDSLMEENLKRLIEPFSRVEIAHVASLIELPVPDVEMKLSQMILDRKFEGILDQGTGCLIVYDDPAPETMYKAALETVANMEKVVDSLAIKSSKIVA